MAIADRYTAAIRSGDLRSRAGTSASDADILGAAGFAARRSPLGLALLRAVADDGGAAHLVDTLAGMLVGKAWHSERRKLARPDAAVLARALLAWQRDPTCHHCHGHGFEAVPGAPALSGHTCRPCGGRGQRHIPAPAELRELVQWLHAEVERETAIAAPAVRQALGRSVG